MYQHDSFYLQIEGSVDEDSTKSDEEYDDLAIRDGQENEYWSHDEGENKKEVPVLGNDDDPSIIENCGDLSGKKYRENLNLFLTNSSDQLFEPLCTCSSMLLEKNQESMTLPSSNVRLRRRSLSIPATGKRRSLLNGPILSGTPQR